MSTSNAHLTLAGAHESFLTSKNDKALHLDLVDFIHVPKLSTVKHYMQDLSELPSLSSNMRYAVLTLADLVPGDEDEEEGSATHPSVGTFSYNWLVTTDYNVGMSVIL